MYIVFEGVDNTGKTTQIPLVTEQLKQHYQDNITITTIKEPELKHLEDPHDDVEKTLRYALQRRIIHNQINQFHLSPFNPNIILSDRSYYSNLAYQSSVTPEWKQKVNYFVTNPTMIFYFTHRLQDNIELDNIHQQYMEILPYNTITVPTDELSIHETTRYITHKIIQQWQQTFNEG